MDKFLVEDENGLTREASIITSFEYNDKKYLLYTVFKNENDDNIFVSELIKDSDGYDVLKDIEDNSIKEDLNLVINELLNNVEKNIIK